MGVADRSHSGMGSCTLKTDGRRRGRHWETRRAKQMDAGDKSAVWPTSRMNRYILSELLNF